MKNLVIVAAGDNSLHPSWFTKDREFELMVAYYGKGSSRAGKCDHYCEFKGTKFKIIHQVCEHFGEMLKSYDYIFCPDDDLFMDTADVNRLFKTVDEHGLWVAQPSIVGWYSVAVTLAVPGSLLRYVNWVEIMCPCFAQSAFQLCKTTFLENKTDWGIEWLWNELLSKPTDKIAVIDAVTAVHTRPCFFGDTYINNGNSFESASAELQELRSKHSIAHEIVTYGSVPLDKRLLDDSASEDRFYPPISKLKELFERLRWKAPLHI